MITISQAFGSDVPPLIFQPAVKCLVIKERATDKLIGIFGSTGEAAIAMGVKTSAINRAMERNNPNSKYIYYWSTLGNENNIESESKK